MTDRPRTLMHAFLDAQRAIVQPGKTGSNAAQGWQFLEIGAVMSAAHTALNSAGLVHQFVETGEYDPQLIEQTFCVVHPDSDEEQRWSIRWPVERAGPQGRRAAISYAQKQILIGLFCIGDSDPETHAEPTSAPPPERSSDATPAQRAKLATLMSAAGMTKDERLEWVREQLAPKMVRSIADVDRTSASILIDRMQRRTAEETPHDPRPDTAPTGGDPADMPSLLDADET